MNEFQETLGKKEITGESGAGLVKVTLNGKHEIVMIKIDPSLMVPSDVDMLEDLIVAAHRDVERKVEEFIANESSKISAGMPRIPGMF
jgi:DNA-binding YbaB/EbfC family protein